MNPFKLASRMHGVSESATLKLNALANQLRSQGIDVVNLTAGEPDFAPAEEAKEAIIENVKRNRSKYTPTAGIAELRELIARKTNIQQPAVSASKPWTAKDVVVSNGGKQAIFDALMVSIDSGDEVIIPAPFWLSYPEMVKICQGKPVIIPTKESNGFRLQPDELKRALTSKTKAILFNSPSNPTGMGYSREQFAALGAIVREHTANALRAGGAAPIIISDEIYDLITYEGFKFCSFLEACPDLRDQVVTVNGLSKSGAMTGWRVGWTVAQPAITEALATLQGQSTSGINALAQYAAVAALQVDGAWIEGHRRTLARRRDSALAQLRACSKFRVLAPDGAFYLFVNVSAAFRAGEDSAAYAERMIEQAKVAVVPGTPFGAPEWVRLSFATDDQSLSQGIERLIANA